MIIGRKKRDGFAAYGQKPETEHLYGIDELQDAADLSLARWAIDRGVPLLAICRGFQIVNVVQGGTLVQVNRSVVLWVPLQTVCPSPVFDCECFGVTLGCGGNHPQIATQTV